jgi:hypothetical protein
MTAKWNPPQTAPKDGSPIIGDFGYPWPLFASWNQYDEQWITAVLQACPMVNDTNDSYFENEPQADKELLRWVPMPKLPPRKKHTGLTNR